MTLYNLVREKRLEIINLARLHGVDNIKLFGSVARIEDDQNSDIDFLIDLPDDLNKLSPWFRVRLIRDLEWIEYVINNPLKEEIQTDGRIKLWSSIAEMENRYLRVILLEDRETVHNAFFDRSFKL